MVVSSSCIEYRNPFKFPISNATKYKLIFAPYKSMLLYFPREIIKNPTNEIAKKIMISFENLKLRPIKALNNPKKDIKAIAYPRNEIKKKPSVIDSVLKPESKIRNQCGKNINLEKILTNFAFVFSEFIIFLLFSINFSKSGSSAPPLGYKFETRPSECL